MFVKSFYLFLYYLVRKKNRTMNRQKLRTLFGLLFFCGEIVYE